MRSTPRATLAVHGRQLNFGAGVRSFEDEELRPARRPIVLTLDYCEPMGLEPAAPRGRPALHLRRGTTTRSGGQDVRLKGETFEPSAGLNYSFLLSGACGPTRASAPRSCSSTCAGSTRTWTAVFDDDDATVGAYVKAGRLLQVSPTSHVGVEFRHLEGGDVSLDGTDLDTGYDQVVLVFGTSFFPGPGFDAD